MVQNAIKYKMREDKRDRLKKRMKMDRYIGQ